MKNLKNILSVILAVIIMLTATSTMAYSKTLDVRDEIQISTFISNEKGSIKIANQITGYSLYYQVNEMDSSTYKKIKQLEDELRVIQAFNMYEAAKTQKLYDEYLSTQIYYKNLYGTNVTNCRSQRADEAKSTIIYLLPDYKETWNQTTDNSFNVNLSSFSGTKDFVVWVQLIKQDGTKVYDAEVFELTGTKKETTNNNGSNNNGNSGTNNSGSNNNGNSGTNNSGSNNNGNSGTNNNGSSNKGNSGTNNSGSNNNGNSGTNNNGSSNKGNSGTNNNGSSNNGNSGSNNNGSSNNGNSGSNNNGSNNNGNSESNNNGSSNNGNSGSNNNGSNNNGTSTNNGKDTSTKGSNSTGDKTTSSSKLPYAGMAKGTTIVAIIIAIAGALVSYIKYKKIK